jgi:transcriptional regulator with XRE-family HTH domain
VRIDRERLKQLCDQQNISLSELLRRASVSPTAYYALARKEEILPRSIRAIAASLGVPPNEILAMAEEGESPEPRHAGNPDPRELAETVERVLREAPEANRDNVWHTLLLLSEAPVSRLKRSLLRGRRIDLH